MKKLISLVCKWTPQSKMVLSQDFQVHINTLEYSGRMTLWLWLVVASRTHQQLCSHCDSPRSWRWSGSGRVWGVWGGCRVCCNSGCTRGSEGRLSPPSAAGCCCCTGTTQGPITKSITCSILLCSGPNRRLFLKKCLLPVIYLVKYAELLPRLTLDLLFLCLNICAGWFFHCWGDKVTESKHQLHRLS